LHIKEGVIQEPPREITNGTIDGLLSRYLAEVKSVGESIEGLRGVRLMSALKRDTVAASYVPKPAAHEYLVFGNIETGECRVTATRS
jgi:hypothetical protein